MILTPAKPIPTIKADFIKVFGLIRNIKPSTRIIKGIMHIGPKEAIVCSLALRNPFFLPFMPRLATLILERCRELLTHCRLANPGHKRSRLNNRNVTSVQPLQLSSRNNEIDSVGRQITLDLRELTLNNPRFRCANAFRDLTNLVACDSRCDHRRCTAYDHGLLFHGFPFCYISRFARFTTCLVAQYWGNQINHVFGYICSQDRTYQSLILNKTDHSLKQLKMIMRVLDGQHDD